MRGATSFRTFWAGALVLGIGCGGGEATSPAVDGPLDRIARTDKAINRKPVKPKEDQQPQKACFAQQPQRRIINDIHKLAVSLRLIFKKRPKPSTDDRGRLPNRNRIMRGLYAVRIALAAVFLLGFSGGEIEVFFSYHSLHLTDQAELLVA